MLLADQVLVHTHFAGALHTAQLAHQELLRGRKDIGGTAVDHEAFSKGLVRRLDQRRVDRDSVRRERDQRAGLERGLMTA